MIFSGLPFLLGFLPLALFGFAIASRWSDAWAKYWLIAVSLVFYGVGARSFIPLLILSVGCNYMLLRRLQRSAYANGLAALGVASNLAVLFWFKYLALDPLPPLGLSFFTFSQIGCLLYFASGDKPVPLARDYALFAGFFPALLAGPILNPGEHLQQFSRTGGWCLTADNLSVGFGFFLIGLLKKTLLSNHMSGAVADGFANPFDLSLLPAWQVATGYSLQLYFDFSGYTDMAIGLAWMFGLRFPDNFDRPYRAGSMIEYWQCWHMSLTRFLMTNVHAPLTMAILRWRRRRGMPIGQTAQRTGAGFLAMIGIPVAATLGLVSIWHGTALTFLVFGLLHTLFLLVNHAWRLRPAPAVPKLPGTKIHGLRTAGATIMGVALTYLCVLVASVFFRAPTISVAASMLAGMSGLHGIRPLDANIHLVLDTAWILGLYVVVWTLPSTRQLMQPSTAGLLAWRPSPPWAVVMGCAATIGLLATGGSTEFVYFRF
jgi:alginate O-acetyltransferase complex protein AlgI